MSGCRVPVQILKCRIRIMSVAQSLIVLYQRQYCGTMKTCSLLLVCVNPMYRQEVMGLQILFSQARWQAGRSLVRLTPASNH